MYKSDDHSASPDTSCRQIQLLRHKLLTPTTPRSWAVYFSSSMQWHWQSSWHLVTCGHVMAGVWNVNDETHHIWMSTQQNGYKRLGAACSLFQLRGEVERRSRSQPWEGWNFMSICPPSTTKQILMSAENGDQSGQLASRALLSTLGPHVFLWSRKPVRVL